MIRNPSFGWLSRAGVVLGLSLFALSARADLYVYQLPDGTRMVTDHPVKNKYYRLVRTGQTPKGMGALLASRDQQLFRTNTAAYDSIIHKMAKKHRVDKALVKAIIHAESAFNPYATSHKGARGLMQLMPSTAAQYGIRDLYNPESNIRAGGLDLETTTPLFEGNSGRVVYNFNADNSLLFQLLIARTNGIERMPVGRPALSDQKIIAIGKWINEGADIAN